MLQQPDGRFLRLFSALVIAAAITAAMLYGMNKVAVTLRMRDPMRYFHISKVIIPKETGAAKRPPAAELPPPRAPLNYGGQERPQKQDKTGVSLPALPRVNTAAGQLRPPLTPPLPSQQDRSPQNTDQGAAKGQ